MTLIQRINCFIYGIKIPKCKDTNIDINEKMKKHFDKIVDNEDYKSLIEENKKVPYIRNIREYSYKKFGLVTGLRSTKDFADEKFNEDFKNNNIKTIEQSYPIDSDISSINMVGEELLIDSIREIGWRNLPENILFLYSLKCKEMKGLNL